MFLVPDDCKVHVIVTSLRAPFLESSSDLILFLGAVTTAFAAFIGFHGSLSMIDAQKSLDAIRPGRLRRRRRDRVVGDDAHGVGDGGGVGVAVGGKARAKRERKRVDPNMHT